MFHKSAFNHFIKNSGLLVTYHRVLVRLSQSDGITPTFLRLIIADCMNQIQKRGALCNPFGNFDSDYLSSCMQVECKSSVFSVIVQNL